MESTNAPPGQIEVGRVVQLVALQQGQYNGLVGTVVSGPSEAGRYMVDVIILDDDIEREYKAMNLKPENLRQLMPAHEKRACGEVPRFAPNASSRSGPANGSYRASRT
jgi:hypothetical protein